MYFTGFAEPNELSVLSQVVETHCTRHGVDDPDKRERIASYVVQLFYHGVRAYTELLDRLDTFHLAEDYAWRKRA